MTMEMNPKVSVIIPIHNAEQYLKECLESVVNQTQKEIEIICVNDASTDASASILDQYAAQDSRIKIITYSTNKSASQARKDAVLDSTGQYIMFLDADDSLELSACKSLSNMMDKYKVDILQFGTFVDALPTVKESTIKFFTHFAKPYHGFLYGKEIFEGCFKERKFRFTLWNKIYTSSLCKKAFSHVKDGFFPKAQDLYAFFILAWFAKSYYGIDKKFYHYNYGRGITGVAHKTTLAQFKRHCSQSLVAQECKRFLIEENSFETYQGVWEIINQDLLNECVNHFVYNIEPGTEAEAFKILIDSWGIDPVIHTFEDKYCKQKQEIVAKIPKDIAIDSDTFLAYVKNEFELVDSSDANIPDGFSKVVPVVFATNDKYSLYAGVAIQSILENAAPAIFYRIYILHSGIASHHVQSLEQISSNQASIKCLNVSKLIDSKNAVLYEKAHFSKETFYRFLIAELFSFYDKVIYLDCDLIVATDISTIVPSDLEMHDNLVAAVHNGLSRVGRERIQNDFKLSPDKYFNAGVLVINVKQWIEEGIADQCFYKLQTIPEKKLVCLDQDILNIVCNGRVYYLAPEWNFYWHLVYGNEELTAMYAPIAKKIGNNFKILHYASNIKPWSSPQYPLAKYFWKYARHSSFYEEIIQQNFSNNEAIPSVAKTSAVNTNNRSISENQSVEILQKRIRYLEQQLALAHQEIGNIHNSWSYKCGRFITFIPRKIRGGIRCYKEHGFSYTVQRFLVHLRLVSDPYKENKNTSIGNMWIFRMIRGGLRCYQEHGFGYTVRRTLIHLHLIQDDTVSNVSVLSNTQIKNLPTLELGCATSPHTPELIVSLTSFPGRINTVHKTIDTILRQTERPDRVILWLAEEQFPGKTADLPKELLNLQQYGLEILWCNDIRSYKKLIPTLKLYPEAVIVTADDDVYYSPNWLELLYQSYQKWPNFIHCHRDTKILLEDDEFKVISGGKEKYSCPTYLHKLVGIGGVLYPPHSLHPDVLREDLFTTLAPTNDDIWFWFMGVRAHHRILVVENNIPQPKYVEGTQDGECLTKINDGGENLFWVDFKRTIAFFPDIEPILCEEFEFVTQYERFEKIRDKNYDYYQSLTTRQYAAALCEWYHKTTGDWLNLDAPITYNEKIQWLKLYDSTSLKTELADKYLVRDWVEKRIGSQYLIPLLGVWDNFDDIDFTKLPDSFVLKANHGCGWNIIVKDKTKFDINDARKKFNIWMNTNFAFRAGLELQYMNISPKIIAEEYMENGNNDLYDYKVFCFNGKAESIMFLSERKQGLKMAFYDLNWNKLPFVYTYPRNEAEVPKPKNLELLIQLSEKLAEGFAHVRVDFYILNDGSLKFGEMTFTSASGNCKWNPPEQNRIYGDLIKLPPKSPIPERKVF